MKNNQNPIVFKSNGDNFEVEVKLQDETVWLSQAQMALLFDKDRNTISEHIQNIFNEGELEKIPVTRKFRATATDGKSYETIHYNLDVIISVGYRVKSLRGTQFRIWANKILKDYLVKGYALNTKKLETIKTSVTELYQTLEQIKQINTDLKLSSDDKQAFVDLILEYSESLNLLRMFDEGELITPQHLNTNKFDLSYENAITEISKLKETLQTGDLFGLEKDDGFKSAIANIYQTFDGKELYKSAEIKAANLLYLIIKNHPFSDGNKRIGAYFFVRFLDANNILRKSDGRKVISENTLVALAIMTAQSDRKQKEQIITLIVNLISG